MFKSWKKMKEEFKNKMILQKDGRRFLKDRKDFQKDFFYECIEVRGDI